ncbi:MAG: CGGC domain-containing protein [Pseudomonadota bacterium]
MKKVAVIGCGSYMDSGYGCPGEWRCLKAAALGEGKFTEPMQVVAMVKCECPGRATVPNLGHMMKMADLRPEAVYLSSCMVGAKPDCPYMALEDKVAFIQEKTGLPVIKGTHEYH